MATEGLQKADLSKEAWREYDFPGRDPYRINFPQTLYHRPHGSTHRVVDQRNIVHCVPAPGRFGCVLRWENLDPLNPVNF